VSTRLSVLLSERLTENFPATVQNKNTATVPAMEDQVLFQNAQLCTDILNMDQRQQQLTSLIYRS